MTINFKLDSREHNRPTDQEHIVFQKRFTERLINAIEPFRRGVDSQPNGYIEVNYIDFKIQLPINVYGFDINTTNNITNALKQVYDSFN